MAESFAVPGQTCDIGTIDSMQPQQGDDIFGVALAQRKQRAYCDCAFLEPKTVTTYFVNGRPFTFPPGLVMDPEQYLKDWLAMHPDARVTSTVTKGIIAQTENWDRCMRPAIGQPWTSAGAAFRNIPVRNGGFIYDVVRAALTIDEREYTPTALWRTFWENPPKYAVLGAKAALFAPWFAVMIGAVQITGVPVALIPLMVNEYNQRYGGPRSTWPPSVQKEFDEMVSKPIIKGVPAMFSTAINYLGRCGVGINVPCGVGVGLKYAAQCQIDDGSIDTLQTPALKAIIRFLAKTGDRLVDQIFAIVTSGPKADFFDLMATAFFEVYKELGQSVDSEKDPQAKQALADVAAFCEIASAAMVVAAVVIGGVSRGDPFTLILDTMCDRLLHFKPSMFYDKVANEGGAAAAKYVADSLRLYNTQMAGASATAPGSRIPGGKQADIYDLLKHIKGIRPTLDSVAKVMTDLNKTLGGALDEVVTAITSVIGAVSSAIKAAEDAASTLEVSVQQAATNPLPPVKPLISTAGKNLVRAAQAGLVGTKSDSPPTNVRTGLTVVPTSPPPPPIKGPPGYVPAPQKSSGWKQYALPTVGGVIGVIGGPAGVAVGVAAGAALAKSVGFSGYGGNVQVKSMNGVRYLSAIDPSMQSDAPPAPVPVPATKGFIKVKSGLLLGAQDPGLSVSLSVPPITPTGPGSDLLNSYLAPPPRQGTWDQPENTGMSTGVKLGLGLAALVAAGFAVSRLKGR